MLRTALLALFVLSPAMCLAQDISTNKTPPTISKNQSPDTKIVTAEQREKDAAAVRAAGGVSILAVLFIGMFIIVGLLINFAPFIIAVMRKHPNAVPILLVVLFFGWTVIGWIIALIWAFTTPPNAFNKVNRIQYDD